MALWCIIGIISSSLNICTVTIMSAIPKSRIDEIEAQAETILQSAYGNEKFKPPVNLDKVVSDAGLEVSEVEFSQEEIAGAYNKAEKRIYVAQDDYFPRQLFTIAHELGHFFLHQDKKDEVFLRMDVLKAGNEINEKSQQEKEADWFAASILMPREPVKNYWKILGDTKQMADLFGVSQSAMRWRLVNIGLLRYEDE